jgi:outer membrane protein OmpA-like peptidoglycan-associated protein
MKFFYFGLLISLAISIFGCKTKAPEKPKGDPVAVRKATLIGAMLDELATDLITAANGQAEVVRTSEGVNITFQPDFYFESSSATLSQGAIATLSDISTVLNDYPFTELFIEGHADSSGNQESNKTLSQLRAKNVAIFMRDHNVTASRMAIAGYGATRPVASNATPAGRKLNRRVLVKIRAREEEFFESLAQ